MKGYDILVHAHSGLRWVVVFMLVWNLMNAAMAISTRRQFSQMDIRLSLIGLISVHLQVALGLLLYFVSPKVQFSSDTMSNTMLRFFTVEHVVGMLIAVILITFGHRHAKTGSFKGIFWYYTFGLLVMLLSIPWPFRNFGNGWF